MRHVATLREMHIERLRDIIINKIYRVGVISQDRPKQPSRRLARGERKHQRFKGDTRAKGLGSPEVAHSMIGRARMGNLRGL